MEYKIGQVYKTTKWLVFEVSDFKPEKGFMHVANKKGQILGYIGWYSAWRQHTFNTEPNITYNNGCLQDIADVLTTLNQAQKSK